MVAIKYRLRNKSEEKGHAPFWVLVQCESMCVCYLLRFVLKKKGAWGEGTCVAGFKRILTMTRQKRLHIHSRPGPFYPSCQGRREWGQSMGDGNAHGKMS